MTTTQLPDRFRRQAIDPVEARRRVLAHVRPLGTEHASLAEAWGRHLAAPIRAPHPMPPFRRSAMDGYAVRAADLPVESGGAPAVLEVIESLPAGTVPSLPVGPGQASRIMTGAMLPEGADTVVMLEMTEPAERDGRPAVRIAKPVPRGRNVSGIGSELREGQEVLPAGRRIAAGESALLAACGIVSVPVARRPKVGILTTGSELLPPEAPPAPGKIRNSNAYMLAALVREAGAEPVLLGHAPDDADAVEALARRGLAACDLLLTTGGVSVGDHDILVDILARWEGVTLFNKITMRPGAPTTAALLDGKLMLALSGNPGAGFVGFQLLAVPVLAAMQHADAEAQPATFRARLAEAYPKINAYSRFVCGRLERRADGTIWVRQTGPDQSSLMTTLPDAECLMAIPPLKEGLPEGALVEVIPIRKGTLA